MRLEKVDSRTAAIEAGIRALWYGTATNDTVVRGGATRVLDAAHEAGLIVYADELDEVPGIVCSGCHSIAQATVPIFRRIPVVGAYLTPDLDWGTK